MPTPPKTLAAAAGTDTIATVPQLRSFAARQCVPAETLCERLRDAGAVGIGLLARRPGGAGAETVVVAARALLRVELRGDEVVVDALEPAARPLLPRLLERLPPAFAGATSTAPDGLRIPVPAERRGPCTPDDEVLRAPSSFDVLRAVLGLLADARPGAPRPPGLLGAFGYELVDRWEDLGPRRPDPLCEPDFAFVLVADMVTYEAGRVTTVVRGLPWERASAVAERAAWLARLCTAGAGEPAMAAGDRVAPAPGPFEPAFGAAVQTLLQRIERGDVYQAVLSRAVTLRSAASPFAVLRALGRDAPWRFLIALRDGDLLGASPETCLQVVDRQLELRPLAGTIPRGCRPDGSIDPDLDRRLSVQLLLDDKEQAEHAMLVDLARNDLARVSVPGTTELTEAFALLRLPRVQHLASRVRGRLLPGLDALHAYRAVANMGTLTGAPKPMAMRLVRGLEGTARGFYGGAVAFLGGDGSLDSCIAIRMLRHVSGSDEYHARAGAGIVHDSVPANEFAETEHKLAQLRRAVAEASS